MSAQFHADPGQLYTAAVHTRTAREDITRDVRRALAIVDELRAAWSGSGAKAFERLITEWAEQADRLTSTLEDIADLVQNRADAYQQTDETHAALFDRVNQVLNPPG